MRNLREGKGGGGEGETEGHAKLKKANRYWCMGGVGRAAAVAVSVIFPENRNRPNLRDKHVDTSEEQCQASHINWFCGSDTLQLLAPSSALFVADWRFGRGT